MDDNSSKANIRMEADAAASPQPAAGRRVRLSAQRRAARVLALATLFETDLSGHPPAEVLARRLSEVARDALIVTYAEELLDGVLRHRRELDSIIQERATAYPVAQLAAIDRNILRLGLYEILHRSATVPVRVAISEAVEIAKLYGGESAARFVNGVLGRAVDVGSTTTTSPDSPAPQDENS
jgi:N utilization substance protein B